VKLLSGPQWFGVEFDLGRRSICVGLSSRFRLAFQRTQWNGERLVLFVGWLFIECA
jgi:hypothetical protein